MKIAVIASTVGTVYKFRFELMEELINQGNEVFILVQNENEDEFLERLKIIGCEYIKVKISRRGVNPLKDFKLILDYFKILKRLKPDRVLNYTIKPNIYGSIVCQLLKIQYINTITGIGSAFQKEGLLNNVLTFLYKIAFKKSTKVFFQNTKNLEVFIEKKIVKKEQVEQVKGSGVNLKRFYPMKKIENKSHPIFLFIGRVMKEKGIEEYLEAAKVIIEEGYKAKFQILGSYEEEVWKKKVEEYESKGYVKYLGTSNDVREQIRNCDCVVNPSYHEGMSNVLLEAGAMGKILCASNIPGCKEIIPNKSLLFKKGNFIEVVETLKKIIALTENEKEIIRENQMEHIRREFNRGLIIQSYLETINQEQVKNLKVQNIFNGEN